MHEFPQALPCEQILQQAAGMAGCSVVEGDTVVAGASLVTSLPKLAVAVARINPRTLATARKPYRIATSP
jgi:hypothetical protein